MVARIRLDTGEHVRSKVCWRLEESNEKKENASDDRSQSGAIPPQENAADALEQKVDSWTVESLTAEKESDRAPSRDPGLTKLAKLTSKVGCFSPHICVGKSEEEIRKVRHFG